MDMSDLVGYREVRRLYSCLGIVPEWNIEHATHMHDQLYHCNKTCTTVSELHTFIHADRDPNISTNLLVQFDTL